jgi:murein DD-endopeptidase MepM/ murein hydrolase activator NlpD
MKKGLFSALLAASLIVTLFASAFASDQSRSLQELRQEQQRIRNAIGGTQSELSGTRAEMFRVQLEMLDLDETLIIAYEELELINRSLDETIARLSQLEIDLEQARQDRDNQFNAFKARVRVMHEYGGVSFLDVLLNAASIRDFLARWEFVNTVAKSDQQLLMRMQAAEDRVSNMVEDIARQKNTVQALQIHQVRMTEELEKSLETRAAYFEELEANEERYQTILNQQRETERSIQAQYAKRLSEEQERERERLRNMPMPQGELRWPVPSSTTISSHYGNRTHPINRRRENHTGVDISARMGSDIVAAADGKVVTASRQGSYGNTVIIEHTGGMSTLYAHCSTISVSVGQSVTRGQIIAKIGSTGVSTGPHLHFEVRINGKDVNPRPYLGY